MAIAEKTTKLFKTGVSNLFQDEIVPSDAAVDELNWITRDGHIELAYGRQLVGAAGATGKNYGEHTGYRADGTAVRFRKVGGTIQTLVAGTWTDVITGLTIAADYTFTNYQSLAGAFVYIFGVDGIYKICTANPTNYTSLYDSTKNFKGYAFIDKARTILWGRAEDRTGLYGSYIDAQNATVYTTVTGEATTSLSGTLAFKAGDAKRTCFGTAFTITATGETYTDNFNGGLVGSLGGTGTINYMTGAYTLSNPGVGTVNYQWENSNAKGVTDFTKSATRLAGEGFVIRQDAGGDAIMTVLPLNGSYFSLKKHSCYRFALDTTDLAPVNEIFRTDIGVSSLRSATATGKGIMFINTANPSRPRFGILVQNPLGDNFDAQELFPQFDFSLYSYTDAMVDTWDQYVIVGCSLNSTENNILLLGDVLAKTVDITNYGARTSTKADGLLNVGDPVSKSTYELFTGFDDLGQSIQNYWKGKGDTYGVSELKKTRKVRFRGKITPNQNLKVYMVLDDSDPQLVGTVLGNGDYVDYGTTYAIGTSLVGANIVGGGPTTSVFQYFIEIKIKVPKYRKRAFYFVAGGIGYVSVEQMTDFDILTYEDRIPSKYRVKQNVSLDGATTDLANPQY